MAVTTPEGTPLTLKQMIERYERAWNTLVKGDFAPAKAIITGDLSDAERQVWDAFPTGKPVDFRTGNAEKDDPACGEWWDTDRQVRAEVLARLLCGAVEVQPGQIGEIRLAHARVTGKLDLPGATLKHRLQLDKCYIPDGIDLSEATTRTLILQSCRV